jgi:aspartyl-tRNA(Asn)/glutamyl-tRNA(Gln) amidotransferase subunit C
MPYRQMTGGLSHSELTTRTSELPSSPMPDLTREAVAHVAKLARLALSDAEIDGLRDDLAGILDHAADLAALDTTGIEPTAHPLGIVNVFRRDEVRPSVNRDEVLAAAPASVDGRFRVPQILGEATPAAGGSK